MNNLLSIFVILFSISHFSSLWDINLHGRWNKTWWSVLCTQLICFLLILFFSLFFSLAYMVMCLQVTIISKKKRKENTIKEPFGAFFCLVVGTYQGLQVTRPFSFLLLPDMINVLTYGWNIPLWLLYSFLHARGACFGGYFFCCCFLTALFFQASHMVNIAFSNSQGSSS